MGDEGNYEFDQKKLDVEGWNFVNSRIGKIIEKISSNSTTLEQYIKNEFYFGIKTGFSKAFVIDKDTKMKLINEDPKCKQIIKPFLEGKEVRKYGIDYKEKYIILLKKDSKIDNYPAIKKWIIQFKTKLEKRSDKGDEWYNLRTCTYYQKFLEPKIIYGVFAIKPRFTLDKKGYFANNANFFIPTEDKKLLGILNSKMGWFLIKNYCTEIQGGYQLISKNLGRIKIPKKNSKNLEDLVEKRLKLEEHIKKIEFKDKELLKKSEELIENEIDDEVYKLYDLTSEEIEIIESSIKK